MSKKNRTQHNKKKPKNNIIVTFRITFATIIATRLANDLYTLLVKLVATLTGQ